MRLGVDRTEPLDRHVRVDLGRREASVAQQFLDGAEVRAALQDVRRRRVPQAVRPDVGRPGSCRDRRVHRAAGLAGVEPAARARPSSSAGPESGVASAGRPRVSQASSACSAGTP